MSAEAEVATTVHRVTKRLAPRVDVLLGIAAACVAVSVLVWGTTFGAALLFAGAGIGCLGAALATLSWTRQRGLRRLRSTLSRIVDHDTTPCLSADRDGFIVYANIAAMDRFTPQAGSSIVSVLSELVASPGPMVRRLQAAAEEAGAISEDLATRRGTLRLQVHTIGSDCFLWRLDDVKDRASPSGVAAETLAVPMFVYSRSGSISFKNEALDRLVGRTVETLDEFITDLPIRSGGLHLIETENGAQRMNLYEVVTASGRREVYVLPAATAGTHGSDWQFFDALPVPMLKIARTGDVQMANRIARDLLGHRAPLGVHLSDLVEGLGRSISGWLADATRGHGLNRTEVVRAIHPPKDVFLQITLGRIEDDGETALVAVLNDATELKTLEAQFVQSQKMQAIGQLAGGVAHDFNNLLTAISGHCDLMLLRHDEADPDYADLIQVHQNANRAASLVGQLLAFSRKQKLQLETLDLRETMSDLTHLLNRLVGEKVRLELNHEAELKLVRADKRQLEQVIMNLVVNARDAMPDGGDIKIDTRCENLTNPMSRDQVEVPAGEYVVVSVADEGIGIPPDNLAKIFEPFWSTKKGAEGTGLGLSTAYGIIKQTGGFIFADSRPQEGTTFTLYLQAHNRPEPDQTPDPMIYEAQTVGQGDGVVLLVEDEAPVRAFASRALRMRGYTVLEADSGEAALKTLEDHSLSIDIFVTDVIMPGLDGPSWVRAALEQRPDTKVVFVSGYAEDAVSESQARIPNAVFLPKPFSLNDLTSTVQAQLS
ncbi:MAG: ATP-binding protein [Pseudomonadota bacterium]